MIQYKVHSFKEYDITLLSLFSFSFDLYIVLQSVYLLSVNVELVYKEHILFYFDLFK